MPERLGRLRGPAVVVLLVVLTLRIVVAGVGLALLLSKTSSTAERALSAATAGAQFSDPLTVVVLAVLLGCCVLWSPVSRSRHLVTWAMAVVGVGLVGALVADIAYLSIQPSGAPTALDAAQLILRLALPALALVGLARLRPAGSAPVPAMTAGPAPAAIEPVKVAEPEHNPATEPVWRPDQAAGAAWMRAGDAAAGTAASGWGSAGDSEGWSPQPRPAQPEQFEPERSGPERAVP